MRKLVFLILGVAGGLISPNLNASTNGQSRTTVVVVGRPAKVELIKKQSNMTDEGEWIVGDLYGVELENIEPMIGDVEFEQLRVEIAAIRPKEITAREEIFLVLELKAGTPPRVLYWGRPAKTACMPVSLVEKAGLTDPDFFDYKNQRKCVIYSH